MRVMRNDGAVLHGVVLALEVMFWKVEKIS